MNDDRQAKAAANFMSRGCCRAPRVYNPKDRIFQHSCCKLDEHNWLKDYKNPNQKEGLQVAEVRFKNGRKDFFSYPPDLELKEGEIIAVEAAAGHDIGIVTLVGEIVNLQMKRKKINVAIDALKKVYRHAKLSDVEKWVGAIEQEEHTLFRSREIALDLDLNMKMNDVEYQGDKTKAIFYYTAEERVDFRELIRRLAEEFRIRIEMRQIGMRQEAAKLGGIGSCGRELCCSSWMAEFHSVSTNVARLQQLSPNPQKLAGQCGKLKCCLNYEYDTYIDALKAFPDDRTVLRTKKGDAYHQKSDIFKGLMWFAYANDRNNLMAIPIDKVKELAEENKKGKLPEKLEDFAFLKEQHAEDEYGNGNSDPQYYNYE
ncbi:MAG: hypothetical protein PWQ54_1755 [Bacteroidales bacterium]|jgi:cell fate regulator YaaT (PSP1 superfamily)|nr:hypothetical protein [Bacteroidales bacterium]